MLLKLRGEEKPPGSKFGRQKALGQPSDGFANLISWKRMFAKRGSS